MNVIVFVGPSLPRERVRELVPAAEVRPPIRRGDLARIAHPAVVAIIDGVFDAELAVSPREMRNAIARGVRIIGSSSMGALRAAEVRDMIGIGRIYEMYRDGSLERDDEVAILLDSETGRALTEPLVNVRFAVDTLVQSGSLDQDRGAAIVQAASDLHFHERVYRNILHKAGLGNTSDAEQLTRALKSVDLKREDAQTLLEQIHVLSDDPRWGAVKRTLGRDEDEEPDDDDTVQVSAAADADAPIRIWEFGESISWNELAREPARIQPRTSRWTALCSRRYRRASRVFPVPVRTSASRHVVSGGMSACGRCPLATPIGYGRTSPKRCSLPCGATFAKTRFPISTSSYVASPPPGSTESFIETSRPPKLRRRRLCGSSCRPWQTLAHSTRAFVLARSWCRT